MDQLEALSHLSSLALKCSSCLAQFPSSRMAVARPFRSQQKSFYSHHKNMWHEEATPQSIEQERKLNKADGSGENKLGSQIWSLPFYCLSCFTQKKGATRPAVHSQTYYQAAKRFITQIPLAQSKAAEQCLKLVSEIEKQATKICQEIQDKMENFKFYIFKLSADVQKMCNTYLENLKFFQQLRVQERLVIEMEPPSGKDLSSDYQSIKRMFSLNQTESLIKLNRKLEELKLISQKVAEIKLAMPSFEVDIVPKRKRTKLLDLPISAMTNLNGQQYFGSADGQIIYPTSCKLVFHQAHDSLIRSFSHDEQYTLFSGSDDFSIKAWNVRDGKMECIKTFGIIDEGKSYHRNISVIGDGTLMVSTRGQFDNFRIRVWSLTGQYRNVGVLEGHESFIRAMAVIDREKNIIMTGSDDKTIKIWEPQDPKPIHTMVRKKKPLNLIANHKLKLCCVVEQDNRVQIIDLLDYSLACSMTLSRKVLCSCGYSVGSTCLTHNSNDYIVLCLPTNLGIWSWDCLKIWSIDLEVTYTPINIMQVHDLLVASDGSGMIDQFLVGDMEHNEREFLANHLN